MADCEEQPQQYVFRQWKILHHKLLPLPPQAVEPNGRVFCLALVSMNGADSLPERCLPVETKTRELTSDSG